VILKKPDKNRRLPAVLFLMLIFSALISCREHYTPKPKGYIRIDYPEKKYTSYTAAQGYSFEYPVYGRVSKDSSGIHPDWLNIDFPQFAGTIYLSYMKINRNPGNFANESRDLAYKHSIKAESISENLINFPDRKVYGIFYDIKGNAASSVQFFVTDSVTNFIRGSLYFNAEPNQDSLGVVIQFVRKDVEHFINTLEWKEVRK
jgi:gliding motility-associated lipoprotein GldD